MDKQRELEPDPVHRGGSWLHTTVTIFKHQLTSMDCSQMVRKMAICVLVWLLLLVLCVVFGIFMGDKTQDQAVQYTWVLLFVASVCLLGVDTFMVAFFCWSWIGNSGNDKFFYQEDETCKSSPNFEV